MSGQLARAAQQYSEMKALQNDPTVGALALCSLGYLGLGGVLHEQGQWAAAEAELQQGLRLAQQWHNQEIADQLVVALSTVKSHVKSILGKLQVQNRTQAAAYARENGLLN